MLGINDLVVSGTYLLTSPGGTTYETSLEDITGDNLELYVFKKSNPEYSLTEIVVLDKNEYGTIWNVEEYIE